MMRGRDWVAVVLAAGLIMAVNSITVAVLYDAIVNPGQAGLSENATQVLGGAFGGIIGIVGGYLGYRAGVESADAVHRNASPITDHEDIEPEEVT